MFAILRNLNLSKNILFESNTQIKAHHFEAPPKLSKLTATPHDRHVILQERANDVVWESDTEHEPGAAQPSAEQTNVETNTNSQLQSRSPFDRNSHLRKPCRHKSLEQLFNKSSSKGDRSAWPSIARAGKWNSLEQVRRRNGFIGERTRSLPASRWQSDEGPSFGKGVGFWQLSEKLNELRSSKDSVEEKKDDCSEDIISSSRSHPPVMAVVQNLNTEIETVNHEQLDHLIRRPVPHPRQRKIKEGNVTERSLNDEENRLASVNHTEGSGLKRSNSLVIKRNRAKVNININKLNFHVLKRFRMSLTL